jgi:hypothetical protein
LIVGGGRIYTWSWLVLVPEFGIRGSGFRFRSGVIIVIMADATQTGFPSRGLRVPDPGVVLNP